MSIFEYRKPSTELTARDALKTLRETLRKLNSEAEETPRIAELRRILESRIAEMERKSA